MKLSELYKEVIKYGMQNDPRGKDKVAFQLKKTKSEFENLKPKDKKFFDREKLLNPYADTRILYGDINKDVKNILVGIDMEIGEILLADRLREKGKFIDLVISHHPEGKALANFYEVMRMQPDVLNKIGVPISVAENLLKERISEVERKIMPVNHTRSVDAARLLNVPLMCVHTPADNCVMTYLQKLLERKKPDDLSKIIDILMEQDEYKNGAKYNIMPKILSGDTKSQAGKIFVEMTGGTEGSRKIFDRLSQAGVDTLVGMHLSEGHLKRVKDAHINAIIAGHIPSDNLGLNLMLDYLETKEKLNIITCSGFYRVKR